MIATGKPFHSEQEICCLRCQWFLHRLVAFAVADIEFEIKINITNKQASQRIKYKLLPQIRPIKTNRGTRDELIFLV